MPSERSVRVGRPSIGRSLRSGLSLAGLPIPAILETREPFGVLRRAAIHGTCEPVGSDHRVDMYYDTGEIDEHAGPITLGKFSSSRGETRPSRTCLSDLSLYLGYLVDPRMSLHCDLTRAIERKNRKRVPMIDMMDTIVAYVRYSDDDPRNHVWSPMLGFSQLAEEQRPQLVVTDARTFLSDGSLANTHFYSSSQFYKPTGFGSVFNPDYSLQVAGDVPFSHQPDLDAAVEHLKTADGAHEPVGVSLEPGSGKTTILPFRFETSRVAVVLPTSFDAFAAFKLASEPANIRTPDVVQDNSSRVTYMDSYTAAFIIHSGKGTFPYDIMIVDECDSNAGITKTITEMVVPDLFTIHLTGTPKQREVVSTTGFPIEEFDTLPPIADGYVEAVEFIKSRMSDRSIVMVPNSAAAQAIAKMIANSRILCDATSVEELEALIQDQRSDCTIIADDSCTRGFNLNLDKCFDFSVTGVGGQERNITRHERNQRKKRVGRLNPGQYYYTPVEFSDSSFSKYDVFRNNVARTVFGLPCEPCDSHVDAGKLMDLMVAQIEPYVLQPQLPTLVTVRSKARSKSGKSISSGNFDKIPYWAKYLSTYMGDTKSGRRKSSSVSAHPADNFYTSYGSAVSSGSSSSLEPSHSVSKRSSPTPASTPITTVSNGLSRLSVGSASGDRSGQVRHDRPPPIDVSLGNVDGWPQALMSMYEEKQVLPRVTPGAWRYTSGGGGVDWLQRLACLVEEGPKFMLPEFEVVCRAWNILVGRSTYSFAKGKDAWSDDVMITFCLEYFDNYNYNVLM